MRITFIGLSMVDLVCLICLLVLLGLMTSICVKFSQICKGVDWKRAGIVNGWIAGN